LLPRGDQRANALVEADEINLLAATYELDPLLGPITITDDP
jgi:hypothetical protein